MYISEIFINEWLTRDEKNRMSALKASSMSSKQLSRDAHYAKSTINKRLGGIIWFDEDIPPEADHIVSKANRIADKIGSKYGYSPGEKPETITFTQDQHVNRSNFYNELKNKKLKYDELSDDLEKRAEEYDRDITKLKLKSMKRNFVTGVVGTAGAVGAGLLISKIKKMNRIKFLKSEIEKLKLRDPSNPKVFGMEVELRRLGERIR